MTVIERLRRQGYGKTLLGALIVTFYLFPVYWMVATSLKSSGDIFAVPPDLVPAPPVFGSYVDVVINNPAVHRAILNSAIISTGAMALTLILAAPAAYALARLRLRFTALVVLLLLITQLLPTINLAVPLFVIFSSVGLIDSYAALILANTVITLPFAIIVLPVVMPGLITVGALAFLLTWGEFVFALTLITSESMQPVTVALNKFIGQYGTRWNDLMAVASAVALPIVLIFASLQRYIVAGLTAGATKE
jgi:multiple sugar transport system permease protein